MASLTALRAALALGFGVALALGFSSSLTAQSLTCGGSQIFYTMTGDGGDLPEEQKCGFWGFCETPTLGGPSYSMTSSGCDPYAGSCGMRADFSATFPGNHQNSPSDIGFTYSYARVDLYRVSNGSLVGSGGVAGQAITQDFGQVRVTGSASCADPLAGRYRVVATMCPASSTRAASGSPRRTETTTPPPRPTAAGSSSRSTSRTEGGRTSDTTRRPASSSRSTRWGSMASRAVSGPTPGWALGNASVYQLERDTVSPNVKVTSISGDCPTCGLGPNTQLFYEDPNHPMLPTRTVDGRGFTTVTSYTASGQVESRTEAMGEPEERTTTWSYDASYPGLVTSIEQPSVAGGATLRTTDFGRDASGNATTRTITGMESGSAYSYTAPTT